VSRTLTETIGEHATNALHEAIRIAWQAGYDQALIDMQEHEQHISQLVAEDIGE
jgi:flagellar biosynthesis/type III secretory pathway protein FliH